MDKYIDYYNDSKKVTYHEQTDISNILKLRAVLKTLPDFCKDYFRAMDPLTTTKTRISYAYDIRIFFQFLLDGHLHFHVPLVIEFKEIPFLPVMFRQIACPAAVYLGGFTRNTEIPNKVFAFLQLLFFQTKHCTCPGK